MQSESNSSGALFRVLGLSILSGFLIIFLLISFYGGQYKAQSLDSVLIAPRALFSLQYVDIDAQSGKKVPFAFDRIVLESAPQLEQELLSKDQFYLLYDELRHDQSIAMIPSQLSKQFQQGAEVLTISILVKPKETLVAKKALGQRFQEIQFLKSGTIYRVSARAQEKSWVYFRRSEPNRLFLERLTQE